MRKALDRCGIYLAVYVYALRLLRKYDSHYVDLAALSEKKASVWTVGAGYEYPFSKRTNLWTYAGYADGAKGWKNEADVNYNGWQVGLGLLHKF